MAVPISTLEAHLESLASDYYDLQFPAAYRFDEPPSALEALRMISKSHPAVIHGFSPVKQGEKRDWLSIKAYSEIHGSAGPVTVAVTDDGLADSVRELDDGTTTFVKPFEESMPMSSFLERLGKESDEEALYLQSQDGNIYRSEPGARGSPELASFQAVVERDISWMKEAIGQTAEAVNLWIGTSRSTTTFHHDPFENIYHVLSGSKTFTLLSPIDGLWLDQRFHPSSTLVRGADGKLVPKADGEDAGQVPWVQSLDLPAEVRPVMVHLEEGDTLYLPAGWWHMVEQNEGSGGLAVAVNYWYPSEIRPERYALERFAKRVARSAGRDGVLPLGDDDEGGDNEVEDIWETDSGDEWEPSEWGR